MSRYDHQKQREDWVSVIGTYERKLLAALGYSVTYEREFDQEDLFQWIRTNRKNPVYEALRSDPKGFMHTVCEEMPTIKGKPNKMAISRTECICQIILYNVTGGPEEDWSEKAIRRHWYAYFKQFAQILATELGEATVNSLGIPEVDNIEWSGRLSDVYSDLVDTGKVTYLDLWVDDASRMSEVFGMYNALVPGLAIVVNVEKDSLFRDFVGAAGALGAVLLQSGKGKMGFAATERHLRALGWRDEPDNQLKDWAWVYLNLSDLDFDGHAVIQHVFPNQAKRYIPESKIYRARVGVNHEQVKALTDDPWEASYAVKVKDSGYRKWAEEWAVYPARCANCGHVQYVQGLQNKEECDQCEAQDWIIEDYALDEPHGYEVEALKTADYQRALVSTLLSLVDFEQVIVPGLRRIAAPSAGSVASTIREEQMSANERVTKINAAIEILERARDELSTALSDQVEALAGQIIRDRASEWQALGETPTPEDFEAHVIRNARSTYPDVWRPFDTYARNAWVVERVKENAEFMAELSALDIEDFDAVVSDVQDALY